MTVDKLIGYKDNVEYFQNKSADNDNYYNDNYNDLIQKRYLLTLLGVFSIVGGNYIKDSISNGISLGGLFLLIFHTLFNWFSIDQTSKIVVLSISLGALLYTGKNKKLF